MDMRFPIRESSILSMAELISRVLGLLFLARLVSLLGLTDSAAFRIAMPVIGIAATFGSIGLPQALTRLFASHRGGRQEAVPRAYLWTASFAMLFAALVTCLLLLVLAEVTASDQLLLRQQGLSELLQASVPLLLLLCANGSMRGMLLGLGSTYAPAFAQILEVASRLFALIYLIPHSMAIETHSGAYAGILTLTIGEAVTTLFLGVLLTRLLKQRGIRRHRPAETFAAQIRSLLSVLRMTAAPTGQSLLASLGYAIELPLAQELLTERIGAEAAGRVVAEYSAIALPLLCAPMVLTDGMAAALLPAVAAERASTGTRTFSSALRRVIGAVSLIALPMTGVFWVLAGVLTGWFGSASAAWLLIWLAPLTLPLFLQAPLASLLQAQGRSRALLFAGLFADIARIGVLVLSMYVYNVAQGGLPLAFAASVLVQTGILLWMCSRIAPLSVPWRTLLRGIQVTLPVIAILLIGLHAPTAYSLATHPLLWTGGSVLCLLFQLLLAEEISPQTLSRVPLAGPFLGRMSHEMINRLFDTHHK